MLILFSVPYSDSCENRDALLVTQKTNTWLQENDYEIKHHSFDIFAPILTLGMPVRMPMSNKGKISHQSFILETILMALAKN